MKDLMKVRDLILAGVISGFVLGMLSGNVAAALGILVAYLVVVYLPGLFWVGFLKRSFIERYVLLHVFGLVATPFLLYVISFVGPINIYTVTGVFLILFLSGFVRYKKLVPKRQIDEAASNNDSAEQ